MTSPNTPTQVSDKFFSGKKHKLAVLRSLGNRALTILCCLLALLTLVPLFSLVFLVIKNGLPLLTWEVFSGLPPAAGLKGGGFGNAIQGTFIMVSMALVLAIPLGVLSAIYVNEYEPYSRLSNTVRFVAKLLTGIPSIMAGLFAYGVVVLAFGSFSAFAGAVALGILILPTILLTAEQALLGVQTAYREASYGLGATKFQTIVRVVFPEALPAIMTGIMLAVARAAGETAPVLFTALFSQYWLKFENLDSLVNQPVASLSVLIYNFSTVPFEYQLQLAWTASLVLLILVTIANVLGQLVFSKKP